MLLTLIIANMYFTNLYIKKIKLYNHLGKIFKYLFYRLINEIILSDIIGEINKLKKTTLFTNDNMSMTFESDRGTEFTSQEFENFIKKKKLIHHTVGRPGKYQRHAVIVERVLRQGS